MKENVLYKVLVFYLLLPLLLPLPFEGTVSETFNLIRVLSPHEITHKVGVNIIETLVDHDENQSEVSREAAAAAIKSAEEKIAKLKQSMWVPHEAEIKLDEAKQAFEAGDYLKAKSLAEEAVAMVKPPHLLYAGISGVVIVVAVVAAVYLRRKRAPK